jgi:hypothetical protein
MKNTLLVARVSGATLLTFAVALLGGGGPVAAQHAALQLKTPIERPLKPAEAAHEHTVTTQANQSFTVTVAQHGIDCQRRH